MSRRTPDRTCNNHPLRRPDHQTAGDCHQSLTGTLFELSPQVIGTLHQRDVQRVLEILLTDYAAVSVRRALGMPGPELLDAEDPSAKLCQMKEGRATHRAQSDDNCVKVSHVRELCRSSHYPDRRGLPRN